MAYKFNPYRSVYRDPQSVKINEILRKRYVDAFAADTLLQNQLSDMLVSAEFAGDVEKAAGLRQTLDARSREYANRGDYETLGTNIARDAGEFLQGYNPLKRNYEAREADKTNARATLNPDDYAKWETWSLTNKDAEGNYVPYSGIEYDENGYVLPSSTYQPKDIPKEYDFNAAIIREINALPQIKQGGHTVSSFEYKEIDLMQPDGSVIKQKVPIMRNSRGSVIEGLDENDVYLAVQQAVNAPEAQAYLNFKGSINTFDTAEPELNSIIENRVQQLEAKMGTATPAARDTMQAEIQDLREAQKGPTGVKREAVASIYKNRVVDQYQSDADRFTGTSRYGSVSTFTILDDLIPKADELGDPKNDIIFAGDEQNVVTGLLGKQGEGLSDDTVITADMLRQAEEEGQQNDLLDKALMGLQRNYPDIGAAMEARGVDFSNLEEVYDEFADMNADDMLELVNDMATEGNPPRGLVNTLMDIRSAAINRVARSEQTQRLIDHGNANASYTPEALHTDALKGTNAGMEGRGQGNMNSTLIRYAENALNGSPGQIKVPEGYQGSAAEAAATVAANEIVNELFREAPGFLGQQGDYTERPGPTSHWHNHDMAVDELLTPLLTSPIEAGGFGLDPGDATDIINAAIAYNQAMYDYKQGGYEGAAPGYDTQTQSYTFPYRDKSKVDNTGVRDYVSNLKDLMDERGSKADEAIDKAARGVMLWPERRVAIGDIDGVESKAVLDALESTTLSSVGAARDLKDPQGVPISSEEAAWRVDKNGDVAKGDLDSWNIDRAMISSRSLNRAIVPVFKLTVSKGSGNNKQTRTVIVHQDDAIIGFENFEPGVAQGMAFSASSMARTEANVLENAVMGAISDAIGLDEAVVTLPGSILSGKAKVTVQIDRDAQGNITGYPSGTIEFANLSDGYGTDSQSITFDLAGARSEEYTDVIQALADQYRQIATGQ